MNQIVPNDYYENLIRKDFNFLLWDMLHDFGTKIRHPLSS